MIIVDRAYYNIRKEQRKEKEEENEISLILFQTAIVNIIIMKMICYSSNVQIESYDDQSPILLTITYECPCP